MPRCRDLVILVVTTDGQTDRQTDYFTPAHARGVIKLVSRATPPMGMEPVSISRFLYTQCHSYYVCIFIHSIEGNFVGEASLVDLSAAEKQPGTVIR